MRNYTPYEYIRRVLTLYYHIRVGHLFHNVVRQLAIIGRNNADDLSANFILNMFVPLLR